MSDKAKAPAAKALPDRLSLDPRSPFFDEDLLAQGIGIKFNGVEKVNVEEYSMSEGWIRVAAGRSLDRHGQPMTVKLKGTVEPYLKGLPGGEADAAAEPDQTSGATEGA